MIGRYIQGIIGFLKDFLVLYGFAWAAIGRLYEYGSHVFQLLFFHYILAEYRHNMNKSSQDAYTITMQVRV